MNDKIDNIIQNGIYKSLLSVGVDEKSAYAHAFDTPLTGEDILHAMESAPIAKTIEWVDTPAV